MAMSVGVLSVGCGSTYEDSTSIYVFSESESESESESSSVSESSSKPETSSKPESSSRAESSSKPESSSEPDSSSEPIIDDNSSIADPIDNVIPDEPEAVGYMSKSSRSIPDFNAFVYDCDPDTNYKMMTDDNGIGYIQMDCVTSSKSAKSDIVYEYINLLCSDYNFELFDSQDLSGYLYFYLNYTGSDSSSVFEFNWSKHVGPASNLVVLMSGNSVLIYASVGLEYGDYGDRTSYDIPKKETQTPAGNGGNTGGNTDDVGIDDWQSNRLSKCSDCGGSGKVKCSECDGSGYVEKYIGVPNYAGDTKGSNSGMQKVMCNYCFNGKARCRTCSGTGYVK